MDLHGRRIIYTDVDEITDDNVIAVLSQAMPVHNQNRAEIQYLYDYYKGKQPILYRKKEIREDICNKIVENIANEIVTFKVGYLMGKPIQYICRGSGDEKTLSDAVITLNDYMYAEDKATKDTALVEWNHICGTAYRMILPDPDDEADEAPFEIYTLDPRNTFVVYHSGLGNKPIMGVRYVTRSDGLTAYSVYTKNRHYELMYDGVLDFKDVTPVPELFVTSEYHIYGDIPIIEYPANNARLGAFEIVLPLLDALNNVASNRLDGVEQFIQSLLVLKGVDIDIPMSEIKEAGGLKIPLEGDAFYLAQELNQTQTQTLVDDTYQTILVICGMPNRNGGSSTSDTGNAVIMRDGWSDAEARAAASEDIFKISERRFLRLALNIANTYRNLNLKLYNIEPQFTRRHYEHIESKAQVLISMLACDKIHPRLAYEYCGMFTDPDLAYTQSAAYHEERKAEIVNELNNFANSETAAAQAATEDV